MTLEQPFEAGTLPQLRKAVRREAIAAGLAGERVDDVVIAVHELAANAVRHGGGSGRLRMFTVAGELHCQLSDAGQDTPGERAWNGVKAGPWQWLVLPGHGLSLVREVADDLSIKPDPGGSEVTITFALPVAQAEPCGG